MPDNRNKTGNQDKQQQQPMKKPEQPQEREGGLGDKVNRDLDKDVGNENRKIQKGVDTDETDEGEDVDEQDEITQRNPRMGEDIERR
jgi:hypothetical protein